ncbi:zinc finger domain-containing protein [Streptomyces rochei]|uniref:zinc finger domain-containing protein n=1 Tax=Streptomyces rochei TaxID=1928 RepID=UPI0033B54189
MNSTGDTMCWQDEMGAFVRTDRRRIQTAVLGGADSDEPLMLPMEAIELDVFRRVHEDDTFWCGTLLGGCGGQLTTKLYTDRACHFAHHPDPDGLPHVCGRRFRGVDSADHLYVRSAAAAWLAGRGEQATFEYTRADGAPIGSVVDVRWRHGALRVHLDQAVAPVWDDGVEPVLGTMVPVDRDILIRRWYVHRIRLDSVGTARHVQIGTEAFARPIEWFALDECEMTERGLSTPAIEKIVQARTAPRPSLWAPGKARKVPEPEARAQALLRRLVYARRIESVPLVKQVCGDIEDLTGVGEELQEQLEAAVRHARIWRVEQDEARRKLFAKLNRAVEERKPGRVRRLLLRVNGTAAEDRTDAESAVYERATTYFDSLDDLTRDAVEAEADTEKGARKAATRVRTALQHLRGYDAYTFDLRPQVEELLQSAALAGELLTRGEARRVEVWKKRAARGPQTQLHVARRYWIQRSCPRCNAEQGKDCVLTEGPNSGKPRKDGHNERLQLIQDERIAAQRLARQQQKARQEAKAPAGPMRPASEAPEHEASPTRPLQERPQSGRKGQAHEARMNAAAPRLHHQVPRGDWYRVTCPRCHAGSGTLCENDDRVGPSAKRQLPHDERLRRVLESDDRIRPGEQQKGTRDERQHQAPPPARAKARPPRQRRREREPQETAGSAARTWHAKDVTCPKCQARPNSPCTPRGPHQERVEWAKEFTRKLWG